MAKRDFLGGFELLVLLATLRLGDDAYGVPIADAIEKSSGKRVSVGSLYLTLSVLNRRDLSRRVSAIPHRSGAGERRPTFASLDEG